MVGASLSVDIKLLFGRLSSKTTESMLAGLVRENGEDACASFLLPLADSVRLLAGFMSNASVGEGPDGRDRDNDGGMESLAWGALELASVASRDSAMMT